MKTKNIINSIFAIIIVAVLGILAYIGLSGVFQAPELPEFLQSFEVFYEIFSGFDWLTFAYTLPFFISVVFATTTLFEKNWKLIFLCFEIVFLIVFLLHGFGAF